jgi:multidrug resistance efflux pump
LQEYLIPGYVEAWKKQNSRVAFQKLRGLLNKRTLSYLIPLILAALLIIRIPLRIVAPCEVVPKDSYIITAPLNGIIAKVDIKPGQIVQAGDKLYEYDARVPLQELKIAEKQVLMSRMEINRATAANVEDHQSSVDLATLNIKLQKAELEREFANANYKELIGKSPISGVALIDNPDEWQGKPVKLGEKILLIADPDSTKVRMWIPENDNIQFDKDSSIKVYLNTNPDIDYQVKLNFISHEAVFTDKRVSSFMAEGDWTQENPHVKLGVKGSAILYGENVSLFYYIFRKPISSVRDFLGI